MASRAPILALIASAALILAGCGPDARAIEHAITIREELGLPTDRDHVIRVMQDPTALTTYGAPMLPEEVAMAEANGWDAGEVGPLAWYGVQHSDQFGGVYQGGGTIVLMFTNDIDAHTAAAEAIAPDATIRVERVEHTEAELWAIMDRIEADQELFDERGIVLNGHGLYTMENIVDLEAKAPNPEEAERWLEDRYGDGFEASVIPLPAPWAQEFSGPGWRLMAHGPWGRVYSVGVAQTPDELAGLWSDWPAPDQPPEFDAETEIVALLSPSVSGSCPEIKMDRVVFDRDDHRVMGEFSDPLGPRACTLNAMSYTFVVALEREALPESPFELWLSEDAGELECCADEAIVEIAVEP
jgi:hypothetical protein